ncbi:MAG: response regulator [Rhodospirillaceae bacterium]|nr:response regulator [Rhodospirillaceae bacterium]
MKKILVIDDDDAVRDSFIAALGYRDYMPSGAGSGAAGLESAGAERPDLVFLDLKMPGMSGVETLSALRALYPDLPIYLVTGFYGEFLEPLKDLRRRGVLFELARKPLTVAEIRAIAEGVLAPRDRTPAAMTAARALSQASH